MNNVIYDYVTFSSKLHSVPAMVDFLGLQSVDFEQLKGKYGYKDSLFYDGIRIYFNGSEDMGICVEMSGQGCRNFEEYGTSDYQSIFDFVLENYSDNSEERKANITRLDIAYDDFDGVLDLSLLLQETQKENFISRFSEWQVIAGTKGSAVNHGSRSSRVYIRIYDKKKERGRDDLPHWVRCEIQLRAECALGFIKMSGDIRKKYFDTLNNYLRYTVSVKYDKHNNNLSDIAPHWLNFIETFETASVFCMPKKQYNRSDFEHVVFNMFGGAVLTAIELDGSEKFMEKLQELQKPKKRNPKYVSLLEKYRRKNNEKNGTCGDVL